MFKKFAFLALFGAVWAAAAAQTVLQVVTKTVEKSFEWRPTRLTIDAEKASIEVVASDLPGCRVTAQLIAKHPDRAVAEADLEALRFLAEAENEAIFLKNLLVLPKNGKKPASNLSVKIRVELARNCPLEIKNRFGSARVEGLTGDVRVTGEFCKTRLEGLTGLVFVESQLGDVTLVGGWPRAEIESNRADIRLDSLRGSVVVRAKFAKIRLGEAAACDAKIRAENSTVDLPRDPRPASRWQISVKQGKLDLPANSTFEKAGSATAAEAFFRPSSWDFSIDVEALFGEVIFR